jgi:hypothetical protein
MIGLSATGRWGRALLCEPVAGPPVLAEADGGKFVVPAPCGLNAERPQSGVDRHVRRVCSQLGRVRAFSARSGKAGAEDDRLPVPGNGGMDTVSAEEPTAGHRGDESPVKPGGILGQIP